MKRIRGTVQKMSIAFSALAALLIVSSLRAETEIEVREATWEGVISSVQSFPTPATGSNYGLFGAWTSLFEADIYVGAVVTGKIRINVTAAPSDSNPAENAFDASAGVDQAIDSVPRWLTVTAFLNGNRFAPRFEPRPPGERTACVGEFPTLPPPCIDPSANQRLRRIPLPFPGFEDVRIFSAFEDWDTLFDGVVHDRSVVVNMLSAFDFGPPLVIFEPELPFSDGLPGPGEDFESAAYDGSASVQITVGNERDQFNISNVTVSNFMVVPATPELIERLIELVTSLELSQFKARGHQKAFLNFLVQSAGALQANPPDIAEAINKLEKALARADGCVLREEPDSNEPSTDWITDCTSQTEVYNLLNEALAGLLP